MTSEVSRKNIKFLARFYNSYHNLITLLEKVNIYREDTNMFLTEINTFALY